MPQDGGIQVRRVPLVSDATYENWNGTGSETPSSWYYPMLLEPLDITQIAKVLGSGVGTPASVFIERATAGLPGAVQYLTTLLAGQRFGPGARDVLTCAGGAGSTASRPWPELLAGARLPNHLPDLDLHEFITAAPFATAPWLVPDDAGSLISQRYVGRILTELRTALWVSRTGRGQGTSDHAVLHPWIGHILNAALAQRRSSPGEGYTDQFRALLAESAGNAIRETYCRLALGEIDAVVAAFAESFDSIPHQEWVDRLTLVTQAPDQLPLDHDSYALYRKLVDQLDCGAAVDPLHNTITRLVVASWLAANTFAIPDHKLMGIVEQTYRELPPLSRRPDVAALHLAADLVWHRPH